MRPCKTPGCRYTIEEHPHSLSVTVTLPKRSAGLALDHRQLIHDAMEAAVAKILVLEGMPR